MTYSLSRPANGREKNRRKPWVPVMTGQGISNGTGHDAVPGNQQFLSEGEYMPVSGRCRRSL